MSLRRAPMALRTPISRVRSVTDTSMMFMTPMPPTSRPMEEITTVTSTTMPMMSRNWLMMDSAVAMPKLSGARGFVAAHPPQHGGDFILGLVNLSRQRHGGNEILFGIGIELAKVK